MPIDESRARTRLPDGSEHYWYLCRIASLPDVEGWVYGKYLSARIGSHKGTTFVATLYQNNMELNYKLVDGQLVRLSSADLVGFRQLRDQGRALSLLPDRAGERPRAIHLTEQKFTSWWLDIRIDGQLPTERLVRIDAAEVSFLPVWAPAVVDSELQAQLIPLFRSRFASLHAEKTGMAFDFALANVEHEWVTQGPTLYADGSLAFDCYHYCLAAVVNDRLYRSTFFMIRYPDGTHRFADLASAYSSDVYDWRGKNSRIGLILRSYAIGAPSFAQLWVEISGYEWGQYGLYVANGYVVFHLGQFYEGGS